MLTSAEQAEIVRANQKDEYYLSYVRGALGDIIHSWLGPRIWIKWRKELDLMADLTYFTLTTLGGFQTLGEEYVSIIQVDPTKRAIPSTLRRTLMIGLQVAAPYALQRLLNYSEKQLQQNPNLRLSAQARETLLAALPVMRHAITITHRCHLAAFYLTGAFYHIAKRFGGVHYVRVANGSGGSSLVYRVLGWLSVLQLSLAVIQQIYAHHTSKQKESHTQSISKLNRQMAAEDKNPPISGGAGHRCALCLETRTETTTTPCGHLFCWSCVHEWCAAKPECPLCRQPCESSRLVHLQNYDHR